ncbi:tetratricopeptide repeat protein [Thermodesulfobacterium sp. TA1]|uniref:tetratricopeptide repeat protein n=1 Tax=Thermodesulfobacterium sp. TA1 TaxID=2234087 RepID=UPI001232618F|nr:tetratricopeptide repeat protein [Thermodesulfobacterium sp. TA1]QER41409.1 tetratricopeptide repeat protein [Thermodesulfobacterium sp. TA1]
MKKQLILLGIGVGLVLGGCRASPQYFEQKISSHKEIAQTFIQERRYTEALKELELAEKSSQCDICSIRRNLQLLENATTQGTIEELKKALQNERKKCDPEVYNLLGLAYMGKNDYEKAKQAFKDAIAIKPDYAEAYNNLGSLMILQQNYTKAIEYLEIAIQNPYYVNAYMAKTNLGWAYYLAGQKEKGINTLLEAFRENPRYPKSLVYLGYVYLNENDLSAAKFYYKKALDVDKYSSEARFYLGEINFREGNLKLAKELWQSIIWLDPDSPWANKAAERLYFLERAYNRQ